MAVFNEVLAGRDLLRAEKIRVHLWPYAIVLMRKYAGAEARPKVDREGDVVDFLATAGAARISLVASTSGRRIVDARSAGVLENRVAGPLLGWLGRGNVQTVLEMHPRTLHGEINWEAVVQQDWLAARLLSADKQIRERAINETMETWDQKYLGDLSEIGEGEAARVSEIGVMYVRIARALKVADQARAARFMDRGVSFVRMAHRKSPNPDRVKVIERWYGQFKGEVGEPAIDRIFAQAWRWMFTRVPIETIARGY